MASCRRAGFKALCLGHRCSGNKVDDTLHASALHNISNVWMVAIAVQAPVLAIQTLQWQVHWCEAEQRASRSGMQSLSKSWQRRVDH